MRISSEQLTKDILRKNNLRLKKGLGQNFLVHEPTLEKIINAAELCEKDLVIEIGPGIGNLTQQLAETEAKVVAIELDSRLLPVLKENLKPYPNVEIIEGDALKIDFDQTAQEKSGNLFGRGGQKYKVVANLPYYITTPIIMHLLESRFNIKAIIVMIQKEVAERLIAKPGGKDYGAISAAVQYYAIPEIVTNVPPNAFVPPPGVTSTVIKLTLRESSPVELIDEKIFFKVIKGSFGQRRKTILNSLGNSGIGFTREVIGEVLAKVEIDASRRGETLDLGEFAKIANELANLKNT